MSVAARAASRFPAVCGIAVFVLLAMGHLGAQAPSADAPPTHAQHQIIKIRILEAHSGEPVNHEKLGVWQEHGITLSKPSVAPPAFWTDTHGQAVVPLHLGPGVDTLSLWVMGDIPCEPFNHTDGKLDYSIQKILIHGVVSDNVCGKARHVPIPGVLIVFVKHRPWWSIGELLAPASTFSGT